MFLVMFPLRTILVIVREESEGEPKVLCFIFHHLYCFHFQFSYFVWFVTFRCKVPESELELSTNITQAWDDLFMESRRVDASLVSVKKKFTEVS